MKKKQLTREVIIIVSCLIFLFLSVLNTISPIDMIDFLNINLDITSSRELFYTLFSVQATFSVLSISIIAIITGYQHESVYGISVTSYITSLKPKIFKHRNLMIFDLIITALNYVFVSFELYNLSIFIFLVSIFISCVLVNDTSIIFKKSGVVTKEIHDYIIENYSLEYLTDLENTINNSAEENNTTFEANLRILIDIFECEINKNTIDTKITEKIEIIASNIFLNIYLQTNKEKTFIILGLICELYKVANLKDKKLPLDIWGKIYYDYFEFLSTLNYSQLNNHKQFNFIEFRIELLRNQQFEKTEDAVVPKNNINLQYYSYWAFYFIFKDKSKFVSNHGDEEKLKNKIYEDAYYNIYLNSTLDYSKYKKELSLTGFCYLLKLMIEKGEIEFLIKNYFRRSRYRMNDDGFTFSYIITIIYLYYLALREPIVNGTKEQEFAKSILSAIQKSISCCLYEIDFIKILKSYYSNIIELLRSWEKYENGVVKTIVMENTIESFILFVSLEKFYAEDDFYEILKVISNNDSIYFFNKYFSDEKKFIEAYENFRKVILGKNNNSVENITWKINLLKSALNREFKYEQVVDGIKNPITEKSLSNYKKEIIDLLNRHFDDSLRIFTSNSNIDMLSKEKHVLIGQITNVSNTEINNIDISQYYSSWLKENLFDQLFKRIYDHLKIKSINYRCHEKQRTLIDLDAKININTDVFIGNKDTFWEEEKKNLLAEYVSKKKKISIPNIYDEMYLLDSSLLYFNISNFYVEFENYTIDNIRDLNVEIENGKYLYYRYSNCVPISFECDELLQHLQRTVRIVNIYADIEYKVSEDIVGCGIEILFDD